MVSIDLLGLDLLLYQFFFHFLNTLVHYLKNYILHFRKFLKDTATIKKRSFLSQNNPIEAWEEELLSFLKTKVIHLWPEGWMTMTTLTKVCNKLFNEPNSGNIPLGSKKESNNKVTAMNAPNLPYPNISITPVNNTQKTSNNENVQKDFTKENIPKEHDHKEKKETLENSTDKKNNNAETYFKVDYEKKSALSSSKPLDLAKEAKESSPNVSIIEINGPTDFSKILPKFNQKNETEDPNRIFSEISHKKERTLIVNDCEVTTVEPNQLNLGDGDDIQKVMEHLKTLQQMSSPVKNFDNSSYSNSSFTQKTSSLLKNNVDLVPTSFQDEYQKQLMNALGSLSASTSKSNYKCS